MVASLLSFFCSVVIFVRVRLLPIPLERDEGEYAYIAQRILAGEAPFSAAYTMKLPGTPLLYAASILVFGKTTTGIHLGFLFINLLTALFVILLAKQWSKNLNVALFAGSIFLFLTLGTGLYGHAAHATHFVMFFALAGIYVFENDFFQSYLRLICAGCMFGLSFLMKQPGILFLLYPVITLWYWSGKQKSFPEYFRKVSFVLLGFFVPLFLLAVILAKAGTLGRMWQWCFQYASIYGTHVSFAEALPLFQDGIKLAITRLEVLWLAMLAGSAVFFLRRWKEENSRKIGFVFILSFLSVAVGLYFRPHYFVLLLPILAIAGAAGLEEVGSICSGKYLQLLKICAFVLLVVSIITNWNYFFVESPQEIITREYGMNPFNGMEEIGRYIRERTKPDEYVQVLGSEPELYFYTGRKASSGYIYMYPLMESHHMALSMQQEFVSEVERHPPTFITLVLFPFSWLASDSSEQYVFHWMESYLAHNYTPVVLLEYREHGAEWCEGELVGVRSQSSFPKIIVWQRKKTCLSNP